MRVCTHTHRKISVYIHVNIKCRQIVCHAALLSSSPLFASMPVVETEAKSVTETADTGTTLRTCLNFCLSGFHVFRFVFMFFWRCCCCFWHYARVQAFASLFDNKDYVSVAHQHSSLASLALSHYFANLRK